eukprot:TRINITY_DN827_c0_g1_i1.p1 TRINITY_DN827_c0_g1~~TRINITY_DN827_c0_g1_i1.p1  ORF type:complete len:226 (+),score=33.39 TRINITY_DN827_c0_g1_i1:39-716(+)
MSTITKVLGLFYLLTWIHIEFIKSIIFLIKRIIHHPKDDIEGQPIVVSSIDFEDVGMGGISMSFIPGGKVAGQRDLKKDILDLHTFGVSHMVTLVQDHEIVYADYFDVIQGSGIVSVRYPIKDKTMPLETARYFQTVQGMADVVKDGGKVHVHCRGGKGRAGTFVFALLQALDVGLFNASKIMRSLHTSYFRNPLQILYIAYLCQKHLDIEQLFYKDTCKHFLIK